MKLILSLSLFVGLLSNVLLVHTTEAFVVMVVPDPTTRRPPARPASVLQVARYPKQQPPQHQQCPQSRPRTRRIRSRLDAASAAAATTTAAQTSPQNVLVTGAAGQTGRLVLQQLRDRPASFAPRGLVRTAASKADLVTQAGLPAAHLIVADISSSEEAEMASLAAAMEGMEAVIICTSGTPAPTGELNADGKPVFGYPNGAPKQVDWLGQKRQIDAAKNAKSVRQVVLCSSMGGTDPDNMLNTLGRQADGTGGNILLWKRKAEKYLMESGLNYTIVHPGGLLNEAGGVRELVVGVDDSQKGTDNRSIPRADVASVLVASLEYPAYQNRSFDVRSKPEGEGTVTSDFDHLLTAMTDNCDYTLGRIPGSERAQQKRRIKKDEDTSQQQQELLTSILKVAAATGRGEYGTPAQQAIALEWIAQLEQLNPTVAPTSATHHFKLNGRWELVYSSTQLFRSSPFFMAGRAVCTTPDQADQYDWFCDMHRKALAISNIGTVRQIINTELNTLTSEFEVHVGAIPFLHDVFPFAKYSGGLPVTIDGAIVSTADITPTDDGHGWELLMDTVEIKGSNIPGLRTLLDREGSQLRSRALGAFLETNVDGYTNPTPIFTTTYLSRDGTVRINRDQDGKVFVYIKEPTTTNADGDEEDTPADPTSYKTVSADLGLLKLLGGFNDAITKFYI